MQTKQSDAVIAGLPNSELWFAYWQAPESGDCLTRLMEAFLPLAHRVLERTAIHLPPHIAIEDLLQCAMLGLYHAITRFDPVQGVSFEAFAYPRIRGAILDELRASDHMSRTARAQVKRMEQTISEWRQKNGQQPSEDDLAMAMGMTRQEFEELLSRAQPLVHLDDVVLHGDSGPQTLKEILADTRTLSPGIQVEKSDLYARLRAAFRQLAQREQKIIYLYYFEELRLSEIAELYELTDARICQILALAVAKLKVIMADQEKGVKRVGSSG